MFSNTNSIAAQCPNVGVLQHSVPTWVYCSTVSRRECIAAQCPHAVCNVCLNPARPAELSFYVRGSRFVNTSLLLLVSSHKPHLRSNKVQASPGFNIDYLNIFCIPTTVFYVLADCISFRDRSYTMRWKASCQGVALPSLLTD